MNASPKGVVPFGRLQQAYLAIDHHVEVCTFSGQGKAPIRAVTTRHSLFPRSFTRNRSPDFTSRIVWLPRRCYGLTLFRTRSTSQEGPTFLPVTVLSAYPNQATGYPVTYRLVRAYQSIWLAQA